MKRKDSVDQLSLPRGRPDLGDSRRRCVREAEYGRGVRADDPTGGRLHAQARPADLGARRGARRPSDVPVSVLAALESGAPSVNHMEQMAFDFGRLLAVVAPEAAIRAGEFRSPNFLARMRAGAIVLWEHFGAEVFDLCFDWTSDTARGWAAFAVPLTGRTLVEQLALASQFADDSHFAVREWAWIGVRPTVAADPVGAIRQLVPLAGHSSPRLRRFACEVVRPRGVWSVHIPTLKADPAVALPLLEPLVADSQRYVRDSVANWLNDASKHQPAWVAEQCARWTSVHGSDVEYVCRRAMRSLNRARP